MKKYLSFTIPSELETRIDEAAETLRSRATAHISKAEVVRSLVERGLDALAGEKPPRVAQPATESATA